MDFGGIAQSIWDQFVTVANAPVPFLGAIIFVGWLIYRFVSGQFESRIANKDSLIALRDAQLEDYKEKLSGASPDEAKARIDALEERLSELGPWKLADEQADSAIENLETQRDHSVLISQDGASGQATQMARSLRKAFLKAGWRVETGVVIGIDNPPESGIRLSFPDPQKQGAPQQAVMNALRASGLDYEIAPLPHLDGTDALILVTDPD